MQPPSTEAQPPRVRRRHALPQSRRRSAYETLTILLLLAPIWLGLVFFGSTLSWPMIGLVLWLTFLGLALFLFRPLFTRDEIHFHAPPGFFMWVAVLAYGLFLTAVAQLKADAWHEWLVMAGYVGAFAAWSALTYQYRRWRLLLGGVILLTSLICWYALIQHANGSRMVLFSERPEVYGIRASGTFSCPNHFAYLLEIVLCMCLALILSSATGGGLRILAGYAFLVGLPALFLTQSRSGWIGAMAGLAVVGLLLAWRRNRRWFYGLLGGIPIASVAAGSALWLASPMFRERLLTASPSDPQSTAYIRMVLWKDTLAMIQDAPLLGIGPGAYRWVHSLYQSFTNQLWVRFAHNEYLHAAAEFGLVGLVLIGAAIACTVWAIFRLFLRSERDREACLAAGFLGAVAASLVHALFDFNFHVIPAVHVLVLYGGVVVGAFYAAGALRTRDISLRKHRILAGLTGAASLLCAAAILLSGASYALFVKGKEKLDGLDFDGSMKWLSYSRQTNLLDWKPRLQLAHWYQTKGSWAVLPAKREERSESALSAYREVAQMNPYSGEALFGIGKALETLGRLEEAREWYVRAIEKDRMNPYYLYQLGALLVDEERYGEAVPHLERSLEIDPGDKTTRLLLTRARQQAR